MTSARLAMCALAVLGAAEVAVADAPPVDLRLRAPARPATLAMRPAAPAPAPAASANVGANSTPEAIAPAAATPNAAPLTPSPPTTARLPGQEAPALRRGDESLRFRFDLGFALEGAAQSEKPTLAGHEVPSGALDEVRSYGFGDLFIGSRGLVLPNVNAYLSAYYRLAPALSARPPIAESRGLANELQIRSGWAEIRDLSARRYLAPLRVRAGRFYVYGPWVTHVDGVTAAWDGHAVQATATAGGRVTGLTSGTRGGLPMPMLQLTARADLTALRRRVPLVASAEVLRIDEATHARAQLTWQPRPTLGLSTAVRARGGALVHEQVTVRARVREISNVYAELSHRHRDDWRWDPSLVRREKLDPTSPRPYLELGPVLPRLSGQLRGGTVLFDNVDVLLRAAAAIDLSSDRTAKSSFSATFFELGGALEVRLRRTLAVGASLSTRRTRRVLAEPVVDTLGEALPLPTDGTYGERSFLEAGTTVRLSLGARTLTFSGEAFGRRTRYEPVYVSATPEDPTTEIEDVELHLGGRASVDAWIGRSLRILARYEVISESKLRPEITGFKALRVIAEATF